MKLDLTKLAAVAMALTLAVFGHADDANDTTAQNPEDETQAARTEMEAARAAMEAAREEVAAAAKRLAKVARHSTLQFTLEGPRRAFLGVMLGEQSTDGIVVAGVTPAGGAETAGIQADDIIVAINGESLTGLRRPVNILHRVLDEVAPGTKVNLAVSRDGDTKSFDVGTSPPVTWSSSLGPAGRAYAYHLTAPDILHGFEPGQLQLLRQFQPLAGPAAGLQLVDIGEDLGDYFGVDSGVLVLDAPAKSELKPGDILRRIDGADVGSSHEAHRLLAGSAENEAAVEIRRKNRTVSVAVPKPSGWQHGSLLTMPRGKARVMVDGPQVEVDIEVEADDDA